MLTRRALLRAGSVLTASTAAGLPAIANADTPKGAPWSSLGKHLQGRLLLPDDGAYSATKELIDPQFDRATPAAVVEAATIEDVQAATVFAKENGLSVAARAGGHSYVGASATPDSLVVDLRKLSDISLGADQVTIGAGASVYSVLSELAKSGRALPVGRCPTVGLAGLTLGGGIGVDSRRYGLTCDQLTAATIVLPQGHSVDASDARSGELFWALRGAGAAIGIATSLTYRTQPAIPKDIVRLTFPDQELLQVLTAWSQWVAAADRAIWSGVEISIEPNEARCEVTIVGPQGEGARAANDFIAAAAKPMRDDRKSLPHLGAVQAYGGGTTTPRTRKVAGSDVIARFSPAVVKTIVDVVAARSRTGAAARVLIEPLDGAVSDTRSGDSAFPWRDHAGVVQWMVDEPDAPEGARQWINDAHRALGDASAGGYANYSEHGVGADRYYGGNLIRLNVTRRFADPDGRLCSGIAF
ncbi:FAD-binding oxidoreductase [Nocardia sp. NPDC046473]|uniref:FAD-binding oxidoreductase n=1 Tax=Nocardia sp. NPDC046473 TaxID=3155733 RepID=UPI00340BF17D